MKVVIFMADGMEMCECLITVDLLRRAGIEVVTASIEGRREVVPSHKVPVVADVLVEDVDFDSAEMIILPGGRIGTEHLAASEIVCAKCKEFAASTGAAKRKYVAAICAAPSVLSGLGLMDGRKTTCHPDFAEKVAAGNAVLTGESVAVDNNIITGQGLGATFEFAFQIIRTLMDEEPVDRIKRAICYRG
ncbi:MAG: DJ-1/PfpI family protein [Mogibacterium sp.]|nr:DJ-1/PfpI family protein [Mogibacterium sp.]